MNNEQSAISNKQSKIQNPKPKILIVLVLLGAAFLRFYQLPDLPPGLNFDEAGNGVAAMDILAGSPKIWWHIGGGKEPLWPYLTALTTTISGHIPFSLRFPAAVTGIVTVAAVYPFMVTLFRKRQGHIVALLTMLGLAVSGWHLHFSRLGFRAILLPLLSTLAFYFLWRGFTNTNSSSRITHHASGFGFRVSGFGFQVSYLIISAFFLALAVYSYLAARFLPLMLILFFTLNWLIHRFHVWRDKTNGKQQSTNNQLLITNYHLPPIISLFVYLLLFLSPLILYFTLNPADFIARSTTVSIFNPAWNNGDLIGTVWRTFILTASTFLGFQGDTNPLVNLPNQPALPLFLAPFFALGLAASFYFTFHPRPPAPPPPRSRAPYLFLLCWWTIMLLPAILAPESAPHHLRLIGAIIPTYAFVAIGMITVTGWINGLLIKTSYNTQSTPHISNPKSKIQNPKSKIVYLLPAICYLLLALQTHANYFTRWPNAVDFTLPFDLYAVRLAVDIAQAPPHAAYILPMDIRAAEEARHYTLDYLLAPYQSKIQNPKSKILSYTYIPVDEHNAQTLLSQAAAGKDELRVVRWTGDKHREADAKEIVTYLLETNAQLAGRESFPVYDVETYTLPGGISPNFNLPSINRPIGVTFDGLLRLDAAFVQPVVSPGKWLPVALTLAPVAPMDADYKASLRLISPSGERVAQKDRVLLHNFHQGTSLWPPETVNEYYLLPVPPETPPGDYAVVAVFYHPDTLAPLVANGVVEAMLGTTKIK